MFHDSLTHRATGVYRKATAYVSCVLFTMLLAAGARAEDEIAELDPNGNFTIFEFFRNLWDTAGRLWEAVSGFIA